MVNTMTDSALVLHEGSALSAYADREEVRELGDRLMAMHPAAGEVGPVAMRAAAQLAILLGANPLPAVNEVHIWKDNKGRNCMSLGINYWRRKAQEWGGYLYEISPRPMRGDEMAEYGIPAGTTAAICRGVRTADMLQFKQAGFTTNEIWDMCGRTGVGTQGANEYAKSGRPSVWTSLKRAETDMLRQLFPAEFAALDGNAAAITTPAIIEAEPEDELMAIETRPTFREVNDDLFGPRPTDAAPEVDEGHYEEAPPITALLYEDGSFVADHPKTREVYAAYVEAHNGKAPANRHNLKAWHDKQTAAPTGELFPPEPPQGNGAYQD